MFFFCIGIFIAPARRRSDLPCLPSRNSCTVAMPVNQPNVLQEFEKIHRERKQSRDMTLNALENVRMQRCASVDRPMPRSGPAISNKLAQVPLSANLSSKEGMPLVGKFESPSKHPGVVFRPKSNATAVANGSGGMKGEPEPIAANLRYMGVSVPSRSFQALAKLMGMDPSGADYQQPVNSPNAELSAGKLYLRYAIFVINQ